ncbi:MAG: hypothetical protein IKE42_08975 [Aquamicrobium sp.]|uniref:hypothetical protein n=1 Tax=Mesorhizobium sp. Pch-S TaxID=2082387 RepID=UPI0010120C40|nr:hypothetical protein [Mesorhizobium sp. Pch-S]MBR2687973.1 hypothetical protein [Aquamicrobium sp.]QAZ41700.1 hypothetical protein C1M53_00665 [Mesorhizobium sp. Pch-S]
MTSFAQNAIAILKLLPRATLILMLLAAPVLAVPTMRADAASTIEAPALKKKGLGLVLLVSLQRA